MVFLTSGTTEWFHLARTAKKNVCHTSALLQGDGWGKGTRLLHCEYTELGAEFTNIFLRIRYEKNKNNAGRVSGSI